MARRRVPVLEQFAWQPPITAVTTDTTPPTSAKGDRYIVNNASPSGDWSGASQWDIAWYDGSEWFFDTPSEGWRVYNLDTSSYWKFNGSEWVEDPDAADFMVKQPGADTNNIGVFDTDGQIVDGGMSLSDLVSQSDFNAHVGDTSIHFEKGDINLADLGDVTSTGAQLESAIAKAHDQNTDQYLDQGGANEISAAQAKLAYDRRAQYDADLGVIFFDSL